MTETRYLLDANVLIARLFEMHTHHLLVSQWFNTPGRLWALSPIAEAAFMRFATDSRKERGNLTMLEASTVLDLLTQHPGYQYAPLTQNWKSLTLPFFKRLQGHKQVMDSYLLGQAIAQNMVLATLDQAFVHLAGPYKQHVFVMEGAS